MTAITPADLRAILRADAIGLVLGVLLVLAAMLALAMVTVLRRRAGTLIWLSAFSFLYGLRLLIRTDTFRLCFEFPDALWDYAGSAITYAIPVPIVLVARALLPERRRMWTAAAIGLTVFAVAGTIADAVLGRPYAWKLPSNAIAIAFFAALLVRLFRPHSALSRELRALRAGAVVVSVAAMADNLRGMELVRYPGPDLEPFGFTVLIASLGAVAVRRVITDSQRLVVMDRELAIARQIQSSILPQSMPRVPGLAVAARYRPMTQVAGDFYDFLEIEGIGLGVLVADVAGHGVPAALIASMVKVALGAQRERATSPAGVLAGMSDALRGRLGGRHVTAAYLFLDLRCGVARYAAAGHPPMLRSDRNAGTVEEVTKNGLFFGFSRPTGYQELELQLREHDRFLLYTDGLVEAIDGAEEQYGIERLTAAFASMSPRTPDEASDGLVTAVDAWASGVANDDLTLVTIDVAPPLRGQQEAKSES